MTPLILALALSASAAPIPISDFAKPSSVDNMKLSPDGRYLAMVTQQSDYETMLVVLDSTTLKAVGGLRSAQRRLVGDFWWVAGDRLVLAVSRRFGGLDEPLFTGELIAVDADGKRVRTIYGTSGAMQAGTRMKTRANDTGFATMVEPLPADDRHAVIAVWSGAQDLPFTELYSVDVVSGKRTKLAKAPIGGADFLLDAKANPVYAWGATPEGWHQLYRRTADEQWLLVDDEQQSGNELTPLAIADDDGSVAMQILGPKGPGKIVLWHPDSGVGQTLHQAKVAEPLGALLTADARKLYGVITADDRSDVVLMDADAPEARIQALMAKSFAGSLVLPVSWSLGAKQALVHVESDRNSGEYYLYDRDTGKARFLLARDEWADPDLMRPRQPIELKARDGLTLHGYLTTPQTAEGVKPPLVVLPHGGPHGIRDDWSWELWSQLLASRGYAVLQLNFRGSGGYGQDFGVAGYRQWGGAMQEDLADAVRWAAEQGHVDAERVCIFGASYGGYAALMSAAREPDMYRCAISYAGLSDLSLMYKRGDISDSAYGENYLKLAIGKDEAQLKDYSPVHHAADIKAAVMLIHGGEDQRVPPIHAQQMKAALEKAGKTVEWMYEADEGHGFYRQAHRQELYERVLKFLDANLATRAGD
ncbi:MAG: S9 family peptidase [Lysobacterales bacterium]|nr:S9 family peptidase [Xanthomonadales bacterium]MCP5474401.1 S9 family peptidase [Rhodanobacteraceae bacterium]